MPYTHKKVGNKYVVYKKGKKVGETDGTQKALDKYLAALHINADKKESVKESIMMQQPTHHQTAQQVMQQMPQQMEPEMPSHEHPGCEDNIGDIYVVMKPTPESQPEDIIHQTHAFGIGQYDPTQVHGIYQDGEEANIVAEAACNELYKHMKEVEDKKHAVTEKIERMIAKMQREVNNHMKSGKDESAKMILEKISGLRERHKMVHSSKKELRPIEKK